MTDQKTQREKFETAAKELGIDVSEAPFIAAAEKIAKAPKLTDEEIKEFARQQRRAKSR